MATTGFNIFPIRSVEDFFPDSQLNVVAQRLFAYLEFMSNNYSADLGNSLRTIHYIDMLGGNTDEIADWLDPYFLLVDITDYADYDGYADASNPHGLVGYNNTLKGQRFLNPLRPTISGRGTIIINVDEENKFKVIVNMLPEQIEWGMEIITYLKTGSFR